MSAPAGSRRALVGIADQIVSAGSNFGMAFVASLVLVPEAFGSFVVAFAVVTVLAAGTRALLSEPLIAHLPVVGSPARARRLASSAIGASLLVGLLGSAVLAFGSWWFPPLLWFVAWLPAALLTDAGRYVLLARLDTVRTLAVDATWAGVQVLVLAALAVVGTWSAAGVAAAWGIGAWAAVAVMMLLGVDRPGRPAEWLREGRYLSGWFTVVSVAGQVQFYAVLLLAGAVLAAGEMAGLRAVQLLVLQPPTVLMGALLVLGTPIFSRLALSSDRTAFLRARRLAVLAMVALGLVILLAIPLRHVLLGVLFPRYTEFAPLVAPVALQVAILGLGVPFAASLRGMRLGATLCAVQMVTSVALVAGASIGLALGGVVGLAWGSAAAAVVSASTEAVVAVRARPRAVVEPTAVPA